MMKRNFCIEKVETGSEIYLSEKERQILILITKGKSNPKIGKILKISQNTVKAYSSKIFEKLNVSNRTQAAVKAVREGLI